MASSKNHIRHTHHAIVRIGIGTYSCDIYENEDGDKIAKRPDNGDYYLIDERYVAVKLWATVK